MSLVAASVQWDCVPSTIDGATQLWTPAEPLLWSEPSTSAGALSLSVLGEHSTALGLMRRRIPVELIERQNTKLQQLFDFLVTSGVDLCVLPEYALLPDAETFHILAGFSPSLTIVAGIGLPRNDGIKALKEFLPSPPEPKNNCVVVFAGNECFVVTKKHGAAGEILEPGDGPVTIEVKNKSGHMRIAVAMCMDYIYNGHNLASLTDPIDLAAIPAFSSATQPFVPEAPRDFPRLFANAAAYGGSTIFASGCDGPLLTHGSPTPLPAMTEGVVAVQWEGQAQKPTPIRQYPSRTTSRGAILTPDARGDSYKIADAFLALPQTGDLPDTDQLGSLERWTHHLTEVLPAEDPLLSALTLYRRAVVDDTLTEATASLVRGHLLLRGVDSLAAVRSEIAAQCCRAIQASLAALQPSDGKYAQLLEAAHAYSKVAGEKATAPAQIVAPAGTEVCYFSLSLGPFDGEEAEATLSEQLDLLRSFARSSPTGSRLVFRLQTTEDPATGQVVGHFHIAAFGQQHAESSAYFSAFERLARPVYLRGWGIAGGAKRLSDGGHAFYICPEPGVSVQIRSDWGVLVDVLRSVGPGCDLEMEGWRTSETSEPRARGTGEPSEDQYHESHTADERSTGSVERFFNRPADAISLGIRIRLRCPSHNDALAELVGTVICGDGQFVLREESDPPDPLPMPVNWAHRILHPPHGHIEGRGLQASTPLSIPLGQLPPKSGAILGQALIARPFIDESADVALPDAGRTLHTYIIGRTGSGKTNTLKNIARHDLISGGPVVVIDPHGELYDYCIRHMGKRVASAVAIDLSSADVAPCINPLYLDARTDADRARNVDELLEILVRRGYYEWYGPRFSDLLRLSLESLHVEAHRRGDVASLLDVLELFERADLRSRVDQAINTAGRVDLQAQWRTHRSMSDTEQAQVEQWFLAKIRELSTSAILERALRGTPTVALEPALRDGGVILVKVPEVAIGSTGAAVVGSMIVERIVRFALRGGYVGIARPASMIVDEFQKFVGREFERLVPEARKFNIGLALANQTLSQLSAFELFRGAQNAALQSLILGNVGNFIVQSIGQQDAVIFAAEFGLRESQLRRIGRFSAVVSVTADGRRCGPFTVALADSRKLPGGSAESVAAEVVERRMRDLETGLSKGHDDGRDDDQ